MMGHRGKLIDGREWDVFSPARRWLCYLRRPGACKYIKRQYNRRQRRAAKTELRHCDA